MRSARIPEGWEFWTSESDFDDAWDLARELKETRERVRADVFVRVQVIAAEGVHWILRREELREVAA